MRACEACKAEPSAGALFCGQCGLRLGPAPDLREAAAASSWSGPVPAAASLRRAERKVVTVLFADVKGSLALVAGQDPEGAGELLAAVVAAMGAAVRRHGGLVNQVMGDGIMALFGAPLAMEDHAGQACLAALALRIAVEEEVRPRVHVRVGLGSGEVVVRAVSGDIGLHYSATGEAVHLAARMEQAAAPGPGAADGGDAAIGRGAGIRGAGRSSTSWSRGSRLRRCRSSSCWACEPAAGPRRCGGRAACVVGRARRGRWMCCGGARDRAGAGRRAGNPAGRRGRELESHASMRGVHQACTCRTALARSVPGGRGTPIGGRAMGSSASC